MRKILVAGALACALAACGRCLAVQPSLVPLSTFGGGDGWVAPGERSYLTTDNSQRGLAYNAATGNLLVVNRAGGLSINVLNGSTGANVGTMSTNGVFTAGLTGIFTLNMIAATQDGTIFACNLADTATAQFRIYRWDSEADLTAQLEYNNDPGNAPRLGDTLDARGNGAVAELLVGQAAGSLSAPGGNNGYYAFTEIPGEVIGSGLSFFPGTPPNTGDHRLGITYMDGNSVIGTQGGVARVSTYSVPPDFTGGTLVASPTLTTATERPMDYAVVDGIPILATVDTASSVVRVYNVTDVSAPWLLTSGTTVAGSSNANAFGVGQVRFGEIEGNTATLYALNTNNGIQAFALTVPEPIGTGLLVLGAIALRRTRQKRAMSSR